MRARLPLCLALLSGACALVYEIVWMRAFTPVFGLSVHATTAVLCAFMGGLGLGSQLAPRVLGRWRGSGWSLYAAIELGIAATALLVPLAIAPITAAYASLADLDSGGLFTAAVRFVLAVAALLAPTFLMGLTLPALLSAWRQPTDQGSARHIGRVYGLNTLGGALGCLLVGFVLVYRLGVRGTIVCTAALNVAVALLALWLARRPGVPPPEEAHEAAAPEMNPGALSQRGLLLLYGLIGALAFGYEMSWFRVLVFYLQNATYSFSTMLTLFLLGTGSGSLFFARRLDARLRTPGAVAGALGLAQLGIALLGVSALHVYENLGFVWAGLASGLGADTWEMIALQKALVAGLIIFPPTFLMGVSFPLMGRLYKARGGTDWLAVGRLYAANTFGAIAGTLLTGFVLFDRLGVQTTLTSLSMVSAVIGIALAWRPLSERWALGRRGLAAAVGALAWLVAAVALGTPPRMLVSHFEARRGKVSFYRESASDITFVYDAGAYKGLGFADGRGTSTTSPVNDYVNRLLAYSAMVVKPDARNVLVISMGCGNTASAFTAFPIERLDIVDISSGPFEAARFFETNRGVLDDPRVHTFVEDGRNFLLRSPRKYDVIQLELPSLHTDGVVFLYTHEFYELARSRLAPGGVLSQWIDVVQTRRDLSYEAIGTMLEVFPETSVWANRWSWWAIGVNGGSRSLEPTRLAALFDSESVKEDTAIVRSGLEDVLASLVAYGEDLHDVVSGTLRVTDDRTRLDFEVPKLRTEAALGGGIAYYNSPLRSTFTQLWRERGVLPEGADPPRFFAERHQERVDRSLRRFASGFPEAALRRIEARNGSR